MPLWGNRDPPKAPENNKICRRDGCGSIQVLQLLEEWKTSHSSSELITCQFLASVAQIEFFSSHFNYFLSTSGNVICQKLPLRLSASSNWAHQALWEGGNMVQTSGWTPHASYSALGDPRKISPCSDMPFSIVKLHQKGKLSLIISATTRNWKQVVSLDSESPNPSKVYTHTPSRSLHDHLQYPDRQNNNL